mmetsp:Transcript_89786/g.279343  ORF Transcript_89786/g.279343 Transcript_89786/m.279343 type:complete len:166 (-) Transcript_89786:366-863(-)
MAGRKLSALAAVVAVVAAVLAASAFVVSMPVRQPAARPPPGAATTAPAAQDLPVHAGVVAGLVGLAVGLLASPQLAAAGVARSLPGFSLARPEYMQGDNAANAATKPGEVDYVTRSQIEWLQYPQTVQELQTVDAKLQSVPSKAERVEKVMEQVREFANEADIPA